MSDAGDRFDVPAPGTAPDRQEQRTRVAGSGMSWPHKSNRTKRLLEVRLKPFCGPATESRSPYRPAEAFKWPRTTSGPRRNQIRAIPAFRAPEQPAATGFRRPGRACRGPQPPYRPGAWPERRQCPADATLVPNP